jgi:hypothetical protein
MNEICVIYWTCSGGSESNVHRCGEEMDDMGEHRIIDADQGGL